MANRACTVVVKVYDEPPNGLGTRVSGTAEYRPMTKPTTLHARYAQFIADASIAAVLTDIATAVDGEGGSFGYP